MAEEVGMEGFLDLNTTQAKAKIKELTAILNSTFETAREKLLKLSPSFAGESYSDPTTYAKNLRKIGFTKQQTVNTLAKEVIRQEKWMRTAYANEIKAYSVGVSSAAYEDEAIKERRKKRSLATRAERNKIKRDLSTLQEIDLAIDDPEYADVQKGLAKRGLDLARKIGKNKDGAYTQEDVAYAIKQENRLAEIAKATKNTEKNTSVFRKTASSAAVVGLGGLIQSKIGGSLSSDKPITDLIANTIGSATSMGAIGAAIAGPVGAAVGAAVGATVGISSNYYQKIQSESVGAYRSSIFGKASSYNLGQVAGATGLTTPEAWKNFEMSGATFGTKAMLGEIGDQQWLAYGMLPEYFAAMQSGQSPMAQGKALRSGLKRLSPGMQQAMLSRAGIDTSIRDLVLSQDFEKMSNMEPAIDRQEERDRKMAIGYHIGALFNRGVRDYNARRAARNMFAPEGGSGLNTGVGSIVGSGLMNLSGYDTKGGRAVPDVNIQVIMDGAVVDDKKIKSSKTDGDSKTYIYRVGGM